MSADARAIVPAATTATAAAFGSVSEQEIADHVGGKVSQLGSGLALLRL